MIRSAGGIGDTGIATPGRQGVIPQGRPAGAPDGTRRLPRFDGADYVPARDRERLLRQVDRIHNFLLVSRRVDLAHRVPDEQAGWRTAEQISRATGAALTSVSAQCRNLRKDDHGAWQVPGERQPDGAFRYRILPPLPKPEQLELGLDDTDPRPTLAEVVNS